MAALLYGVVSTRLDLLEQELTSNNHAFKVDDWNSIEIASYEVLPTSGKRAFDLVMRLSKLGGTEVPSPIEGGHTLQGPWRDV